MFNTSNYEPEDSNGAEAFQATEIRREFAGHQGIGEELRLRGRSRPNRRKNQVEGLCRVPQGTLPGICQTLDRPPQTHGEGGVPGIPHEGTQRGATHGAKKVTYPKGKPEGSKHSEAEQVSTDRIELVGKGIIFDPKTFGMVGGLWQVRRAETFVGGRPGPCPAKEVYVGGLRDPFKVVNARAAMLRVRAAWEALVRKMPHATQVAESYGTKQCYLDKRVVEEWKASLRKVLGAAAPKAVRIKGRYEYTSPRDPGLLEAWTNKSGLTYT